MAETPEETPVEETGKGLRAQLEKQIAATKAEQDKNAALTTKLLENAYTDLNLDPTTGLGKAIAKEYQGEASADALAAYAKAEYGYEHTPVDPAHPQAADIANNQAALDQMGNTAGSIVPPSEKDTLAKAEAEGDYVTTVAIKGQQVADMFRGR